MAEAAMTPSAPGYTRTKTSLSNRCKPRATRVYFLAFAFAFQHPGRVTSRLPSRFERWSHCLMPPQVGSTNNSVVLFAIIADALICYEAFSPAICHLRTQRDPDHEDECSCRATLLMVAPSHMLPPTPSSRDGSERNSPCRDDNPMSCMQV
ncbi:hypothetical protein K505DRAFT_332043 [Melanomma pulvis-pyrius CBS 109.77]|uniref:Uncharacterized protein n=1 Tax=Melanomma pulvis-pyrius CBS 109.77 TaxID=1314802 RepID=A0A6A6XTW2_9PLEO|nr:hypothetical protein K505DRAFT_332043 [Melanomma pulvis-pyrius CBS 109.77]